MRPQPAWRRYLRFWGPDPQSDFDDELQFHLETKVEELMAAGMPENRAWREAKQQFGPVRRVRQECCQISMDRQGRASRAEYCWAWLRDLRYAARVLARSKASSAAAILILAVGIGATTAVFTLFDRLLFRPLPVPRPSELVLLSNAGSDAHGAPVSNRYFSYDQYINLRDHNQALAGLAAESYLTPREHRKGQRTEAPASASAVSGNFFDVLRVSPAMGRGLAGSDDLPGSARVAVASYRFWNRRYQLAGNVLGQTVYLKDLPFTIVGVMPEGFFGTHQGYDTDLYVPLGCLPELFGQSVFGGFSSYSMGLIGRLKQGVHAAQGQTNLQLGWDQYLASNVTVPAGRQPLGQRLECADGSSGYAGAQGEKQRSMVLLSAIVAVLLLMGCANVACLLMARGASRQHEVAIRLSLGSGTLRVLRQILMESCLLAVAGGAAGILLSLWADRLLLVAFQWQKRPIDLDPDWRVLAFALGLSLATGVLFGLAPALQLLRSGRVAPVRTIASSPRLGSGRALVVVEVALSMVLVAGAGVFLRSFQNLRSVPTGFDAAHVTVVPIVSATDDEAVQAPYQEAAQLVDVLRNSPGVEAAAMADFITFDDGYAQTILKEAGNPTAPVKGAHIMLVDGGYFAALRVPLLAGRAFTSHDDGRAPRVAILAEGTARRWFPGQNPLGKRLLLGAAVRRPEPAAETEIVGVVQDIRFTSLAAAAPDLVFQPVLQGENHTSTVKLQVRSRMRPAEVAALVKSRIQAGHLPVIVETASALDDRVGASLQNDRLRMQASTFFGGLALVLIVAGIYGLMAYSVARRTREIGIRMAVGSSGPAIVKLVMNESLRLVACGVALGIPGAILVMKLIAKLVFGIAPVDVPSLLAAVAILAATGVAASGVPAWRAARLDPVDALRVQ